MGPERIRFNDSGPACIQGFWALVSGSDSITPMILIGVAAARPSQDSKIEALERCDHIIAKAASVRNRRVFTNPDAVIDAAAQVFGKTAIDIAADRRTRLVSANRDLGLEWFAILSGFVEPNWGARPCGTRLCKKRIARRDCLGGKDAHRHNHQQHVQPFVSQEPANSLHHSSSFSSTVVT